MEIELIQLADGYCLLLISVFTYHAHGIVEARQRDVNQDQRRVPLSGLEPKKQIHHRQSILDREAEAPNKVTQHRIGIIDERNESAKEKPAQDRG